MTTGTPITSRPARSVPVPPLQSGDRLDADEFERRYDAAPDLKKAELIDGVVYVPPPVSDAFHGEPQFRVVGWLALYVITTPGVTGSDNSTLRLDRRNRPQPDTFLRILPTHGGRAQRDAQGYVTAGPDLVVEVAASRANYDLNDRLEVYRRFGVREYVVWRVYDQAVDWFILRGEHFDTLSPGADGVFRSEFFPGLWLDPAALIRNDLPQVAKVLQQGLATVEHAAFVERLRQAGDAAQP